jgi:hypothetical protein
MVKGDGRTAADAPKGGGETQYASDFQGCWTGCSDADGDRRHAI